jgi:lipooligosaccharide transport system permease protein
MIISAAVALADARIGKIGDRIYAGRPSSVLERSWISFKSSAWFAIVSGFLEPVLFLFSFGYGVGKLVGTVSLADGSVVTYAMFIAPGLLATSAMNGAIFDTTWNVYFKMHESKTYNAMLSTSLGPLDVALGEITWAVLRGVIYSIGFMLVVTPLGLIPSWWAILTIPAAALIAFAFASIGMALTSYFKSYQQLGLIEVFLLPVFLFSGSLFPTEILPSWANLIVKISPLWHAIELIRMITFGDFNINISYSLMYFFILIFLSFLILIRRFNFLYLN